MAPGKVCSGDLGISDQEVNPVDVLNVSMFVLYPINLLIAGYFIRSLIKSENLSGNRFGQSLLTYIICSCTTLSLVSVGNWIIIGTGWGNTAALSRCAAFDFFTYLFLLASYLAVLEVQILRVQVSFEKSVYALNPRILTALHSAVITAFLFGMVVLIVRATKVECFMELKSGLLWKSGLVTRKHFFMCFPRRSNLWMGNIVVSLSLFLFIVSTVVLGWVFISKMRMMNSTVSGGPSKDRISQVILKSAILVSCSMLSTVFIIIFGIATELGFVLYLDLTLNQILMLCMVKSGERLYSFLFGGCVRYLQLKYPQFSESLVSPNHTQLTSISDDVRSKDSSQVCV